jgi:hypothetical protein
MCLLTMDVEGTQLITLLYLTVMAVIVLLVFIGGGCTSNRHEHVETEMHTTSRN